MCSYTYCVYARMFRNIYISLSPSPPCMCIWHVDILAYVALMHSFYYLFPSRT